jgi:LPXTG-site transpeptidase (sortase) family protein
MRRLSAPLRYVLAAALVLVLAWSLVAPRASVLRARAATMLTPSGEITRIAIPAIGVDSRVIEVRREERDGRKTWRVADYAVGHHAGSGAPGGGTNIVLSGHNNINGEVFRRLDELRRGDRIALETRSEGTRWYAVSGRRIVREEGVSTRQRLRNARYMKPTATERLTLISCWPYKPWPPYRIIITADPLPEAAR